MKRGADKKPLSKRNSKSARTKRSTQTNVLTGFLDNLRNLISWFFPAQAFPFLFLPVELQLAIMQYLPLKDLNAFALVSKKIAGLASDNSLWKKFALACNVHIEKQFNRSKIENYKNLLKACLEVRKMFPSEIIDIFESEQELAQLPILNPQFSFGHNYTNFSIEDLKGHKIMRGISINAEPFVVFCVKTTDTQPGESREPVPMLEAYSFYRSKMEPGVQNFRVTYNNGGKFKSFRGGDPLFAKLQDYFKRLTHNEPCQLLREPFASTLDNKNCRKMVELTDQTEFGMERHAFTKP